MQKFSFKWWVLSFGAVMMTLWICIVFTFLFIGRELLLFGSFFSPFNKGKDAPAWVKRWAHRLQEFYEDYLKL